MGSPKVLLPVLFGANREFRNTSGKLSEDRLVGDVERSMSGDMRK